MSNLSSTARTQGFEALLNMGGECLVLLAGERIIYSTTGLVNRGGDMSPLERGQVDFEERNRSTIEVSKSVSEAPKVGQTWKDDCGTFHRIKSVKATDISYYTICEPAPTDDDE